MSTAEAATLVRLSLDSRASVRADPERLQLLARYHADTSFQADVRGIADGLGLDVLADGREGLVLSARSDGPFAPRLEDYPLAVRSAAERLCHGLIHVAIASLAYPRADDLDEQDRVIRLSVHEVDEHLWRLADARLEADPDAADAIDGDLGLVPAWAAWRRQRRAGQTQDGRAHMRTTRRWIEVAFEWLSQHDLALRVTDEGGGTFRLTRRHRTLVREVTSQRLVDAIRRWEAT